MTRGSRPPRGRAPRRQPWKSRRRILRATYLAAPAWAVATAAVLLLGVVAAAAHSMGYPPLQPTLVATGLLTAAHLALHRPAAAATAAVVAVYLPLTGPLGVFFAYAAAGARADLAGGSLNLMAAAVLVGLIAQRTSRGRAWLTAALALGSMSVIAPLLVGVAPWLGFTAAYFTAGVVLWARGGGPARLADWWDTNVRRRGDALEVPGPKRTRRSQQETAVLLADLDDRYQVLHDVPLRHRTVTLTVDHLVVGPTGLHLLLSQRRSGVVRDDPQLGLSCNGQPFTDDLATLLEQHRRLARALSIPAGWIQPVIVVHGARLPRRRTRVALFDDFGARMGDVLVVAPDVLTRVVKAEGHRFSDRRRQAITRRVLRRLLPDLPRTGRRSPERQASSLPVSVDA